VKEYSIFQSTPGCLSPLHVLVGCGFARDFRRAKRSIHPLRAALRIPFGATTGYSAMALCTRRCSPTGPPGVSHGLSWSPEVDKF
jgi:hypothetical protein